MENSVKLEMSFTFSRQRKIWSSRLAILKRMQKKCTEIYNTRAKPLLCSLNLLLGEVPVAAAVVVFLNFLIFVYKCPCMFSRKIEDVIYVF